MGAGTEFLQGTLVVDRRGDIRMCSGPLARRVGRRAPELAGEPVWTLLPGWTPFGEAGAETSLRLLSGHGGAAVRVSWEAVHLPGDTLFVVEVRGAAEPQAPPGLAAAAELSPDAMMITDRRGVIQYVNSAFEAMTGYTQIELVGRTPAVLKSGAQDAGFYRELHMALSREIAREHRVMLLLGSMHAEQRLATFLLSLSRRFGRRGYSPSDFQLCMTRADIGSYLGMTLETVSRLFSRLQEQGIVEIRQRHVRLVDADRLRAIAEPA